MLLPDEVGLVAKINSDSEGFKQREFNHYIIDKNSGTVFQMDYDTLGHIGKTLYFSVGRLRPELLSVRGLLNRHATIEDDFFKKY